MTEHQHYDPSDDRIPSVSVVPAGQGRVIHAGGLRLHLKEDGPPDPAAVAALRQRYATDQL